MYTSVLRPKDTELYIHFPFTTVGIPASGVDCNKGAVGDLFKPPVLFLAIHHSHFWEQIEGNRASKCSAVVDNLAEPAQILVPYLVLKVSVTSLV